MTKNKENKGRPRRYLGTHSNVRIERVPDAAHGREVWLFSTGDRTFNIATSNSSATIMDEALTIYAPALKRLAKR